MTTSGNTSLNLINLDFDAQQQDLIAFLKGQTIFKDYDFSGSNMNVLTGLLAHNTLKNIFFLNMGISEGFIDSAQLRNTLFSHAKELNYLPRSYLSAAANVTVSFTASGYSQPYIIQKGQSFSTLIKNQSLVYTIPETIICSSANNTFTFTTPIYEGIYFKDSYIFNNTQKALPLFKITNPNIDLSSLVVTVYEDQNVVGQTYTYKTSLLGLDQTSQVFFVQTNVADGSYEVMFGDGVCGYAPKNNSTIILDYRVSSGSVGNGGSVFSINFDPTGNISELTGPLVVTTNENSTGGIEQQTLDSVRFYAPRYFETQERAVTSSDYKVLLQNQFPEIQSINAYGGDELTPPQYGKVVIVLVISNVNGLPSSKIAQYNSFIKSRSPLTIQTLWASPQYTFLQINSIVRYNVNITSDTINRINSIVTAAISNFNTTYLNDFNTIFRDSQLSTTIDQCDPSIISNITNIKIYQKLAPSTSLIQNYTLNFAVPLVNTFSPLISPHAINDQKTLTSDTFTFRGNQCQLEDDGNGNINIVQVGQNTLTKVASIGSINYTTGIINLIGFIPDSYLGQSINIYVIPADDDVAVSQNTILAIEPAGINLTIQQVQQ